MKKLIADYLDIPETESISCTVDESSNFYVSYINENEVFLKIIKLEDLLGFIYGKIKL